QDDEQKNPREREANCGDDGDHGPRETAARREWCDQQRQRHRNRGGGGCKQERDSRGIEKTGKAVAADFVCTEQKAPARWCGRRVAELPVVRVGSECRTDERADRNHDQDDDRGCAYWLHAASGVSHSATVATS